MAADLIPHDEISYRPIASRNLSLDTCKLFSYGFSHQPPGPDAHVAQFWNKDGIVGQKLRKPGKIFEVYGARPVWAAMLWAEIVGQAHYLRLHGEFPVNQKKFVRDYLVDENVALFSSYH